MLFRSSPRLLSIKGITRHIRIVPLFVFFGYESKNWPGSSLICFFGYALAIDRTGNCLPKFLVSKPFKLDRRDQRLAQYVVAGILIEPKEFPLVSAAQLDQLDICFC